MSRGRPRPAEGATAALAREPGKPADPEPGKPADPEPAARLLRLAREVGRPATAGRLAREVGRPATAGRLDPELIPLAGADLAHRTREPAGPGR